MEKIIILIIFALICFSLNDDNNWRNYPACKLGRLQSPIEINEYESSYSNDFSFVYQDYKSISNYKISEVKGNYALTTEELNGGYINFERGGVIKQYIFKKAELYPGLHKIDGDSPDYELHLVHEKNLEFKTNKNQYRSIQDPNMFLTIVLRYKKDCGGDIICTSDDGLLAKLLNKGDSETINLNNYPIFQDKRAYFYEGSSIHIPCDENINYYIVKDLFHTAEDLVDKLPFKTLDPHDRFGRPVYKNFMNYREVMKSNIISIKIFPLLLLLFILF
jgi:carbonic anhydrase